MLIKTSCFKLRAAIKQAIAELEDRDGAFEACRRDGLTFHETSTNEKVYRIDRALAALRGAE